MTYCRKCGRLMPDSQKFCGFCGAPAVAPEQPRQQTQSVYGTAPTPSPPRQPAPQYQQPPQTYPPAAPAQYPPPPPPPAQGPVIPPPAYPPQPVYKPQQPQFQQPPAYALPPAPAAPVQSGAEAVVGAVTLRKPKSFGRWDTWAGVITNYRLIFAQMTEQMAKDGANAARDQAKVEGKSAWGQWGAQLSNALNFGQRYMGWDPNRVLAETHGNFAIDNAALSEIKLHIKDRYKEQHRDEFKVEFKSAQGTYEFVMDQNNQLVDTLKRAYGAKVQMPFGYFSTGKTVGIGFKLG